MKNQFQLLIAIILFTVTLGAFASRPHFAHITINNGLPHQQVSSLAQDHKGYIWIGTRNGLSRYDGYALTNYYHNPSDKHSLFCNFITCLFTDSRGRLWIGTDKGIGLYRQATDDFESIPTDIGTVQHIGEMKDGRIVAGGGKLFVFNERRHRFVQLSLIDDDYVVSLATDRHNRLFVATNHNIYCYSPTFTRISKVQNLDTQTFLTGNDGGIVPMMFDSKGRLWVGRNGKGVMCHDMRTGRNTLVSGLEGNQNIVRSITEDRQHNIWLGTEKGIVIVHPDMSHDNVYQDFRDRNLINDNAIYGILCDKADNMWIGTFFGGVNLFQRSSTQFLWYEPGYETANIKGKAVRMMCEPQPGLLWVATEDGGLNVLDTHAEAFSMPLPIATTGRNVHSLCYDPSTGDMWIGTFLNGLLCYNTRSHALRRYKMSNGLNSDAVFYLARQRNGTLWVATTHGLYSYDKRTDRFNALQGPWVGDSFMYTLCVDGQDNVWVGSTRAGLFCVDARTHKLKHWSTDGKNGLADNYITSLYATPRQVLIGTSNNGLQVLDRRTGRIGWLSDDNMLRTCTVCGFVADRCGNVWVTTSQGLFRYTIATKDITRFTEDNGLPTNQFNFSSAFLASSGMVYVGTVNGLVAFNPKDVKTKDGPYDVHFSQLTVNNLVMTAATPDSPLTAPLDDTPTLTLSYGESRSFSIGYGVVMPGNAEGIEYEVMLEGADRQWRNVGSERVFFGFNLAPGTYTLKVRASSNGNWDVAPVKSLRIIVRPHVLLSVWALMFYLVVLGFCAWLAYRHMLNRMRERESLKKAQREKERIEEIDKAKMEFFTTVSHELKTPLSLIAAPLRTIKTDKMDAETAANVELAVKNTVKLEKMIGDLVTFNKVESGNFPFYLQYGNPIEFVSRIMAMMRHLADEKEIIFTTDCQNNGEEVWFSPTYVEHITTNLVLNAIKYTSAGGHVIVKSDITTGDDLLNYLRIEVADNGIGIEQGEIDNIFNRFYQTRRGYNAAGSGWGIGLALVKKMAEIHHGSVHVASSVGKGSTFTAMLCVSGSAFPEGSKITQSTELVPLNHYMMQSVPDIMSQYLDSDAARHSDISLLIVEDNADMLHFLAGYFRQTFNVYTAANGQEALSVLAKYSVQLVVSDVMMPVMDGYELCHRIKTDMNTSHIPVVLLTARSDSSDMLHGYKCGAEAYVMKPFDPQMLNMQVSNIIRSHRQQQERFADGSATEQETDGLTDLDRDFLARVSALVNDNIGNSGFGVQDVTTALGVSRSLLHVKMKSLLNMSMGDYIKKRRLERACQLLRSGKNVSETAYMTGFSDPNYFSKAFKKHFGMSPTEYINGKGDAEGSNS